MEEESQDHIEDGGTKPHVSPSQISMIEKCGVQYEFRYDRGIKRPPGIALVVGTGTHGGIEKDLKHKRDTGSLLALDEVQDAARDATVARWNEMGVSLSEEERSIGITRLQADAIDMAVSLAAEHHRVVAPTVNPVRGEKRGVERWFRVVLEDQPRDFVGKIDIEEELAMPLPAEGDSPETQVRVRDTKTAKSKPRTGAIYENGQLISYGLAMKVLDGRLPVVQIDTLVKKKKPEAISESMRLTQADLEAEAERIVNAIKVIESGARAPAPQGVPGVWWCSPKFCGYWSDCPYARGKKVFGP